MSTEATVPRKNILDTIHIRRDLADRPFILPMPDVRGISGEMVHRARIECQEVNSEARGPGRKWPLKASGPAWAVRCIGCAGAREGATHTNLSQQNENVRFVQSRNVRFHPGQEGGWNRSESS